MRQFHLPLETVSDIKRRINAGEYQHNIAAHYGINQGRISEIKTGQRWPEVEPLINDH